VLANPKVYTLSRTMSALAATQSGFDAIVSNTTFHFRANTINLLSAEFLALVKEHLSAGGIVFYNTTDSRRVQRTG